MKMFRVYAEPQGKARPRFSRAKNGVVTFTPQKTRDFEQLVKDTYLARFHDEPSEKALGVFIKARFTIPKSWSKKKQEQAKKGELYPTKKPDADNIAKAICDALNGIAYKDDSQIVDLKVEKRFAEQGSIGVLIQELE